MRVLAVTFALLLSLTASQAIAAKSDIMPAPHKAPRVPVQQLTLYEPSEKYTPPPKPSVTKQAATKPPSLKTTSGKEVIGKEVIIKDSRDLKDAKEFEGMAKALDGERILVGEKEIRLFGIVTPNISSNYGPQARSRLDAIIKGPVLCKVTDKDRDGRPIAFCGTVDTPDLSYEMLRQGWAMVDRKALKNNTLAEVYEKVEQQAQAQNKGLFAPMPMVNAIPLSNPANSVTIPLVAAATASLNKDGVKSEEVKTETSNAEVPKAEITKELPGTAFSLITPMGSSKFAQASVPVVAKAEPIKTEETKAPEKIVEKPATKQEQGNGLQGAGFFERYQAIVGGFLWVLGAFAFGGAMVARDRLQEISKRKALAAALNGELTSARHICRTRARELTRRRHMGEDDTQLRPSQLWPRIRALVYQSHVGSIGLLGSDLARRVAAIYGQCADYAVYYQQTGTQRLPSGAAVSETLLNLADHIDGILDVLTYVEQTGKAYVAASEETVVTESAEVEQQVKENQEQARHSVNEEARIIKERFERMATSMVGMLGRKREAANSPVVVAGDTTDQVAVAEPAAPVEQATAAPAAGPSPSQAA